MGGGLSSRLFEAATRAIGRRFSQPTHTRRCNVARRFTWSLRHSDFAPRADDADGAHDLGSHGVLLITKYMLDAGAHLRARRIGGILPPPEFAISLGPARKSAFQAALPALF